MCAASGQLCSSQPGRAALACLEARVAVCERRPVRNTDPCLHTRPAPNLPQWHPDKHLHAGATAKAAAEARFKAAKAAYEVLISEHCRG